LDILGKWKFTVGLFVRDLHFVQSEYNKNKEDPPLARNLPPTSGKIAWSRQLYRRISAPVAVFQKNQQLLQLPETRKAIKHYNRLARVLVEYEMVFFQLWTKQIDSVKDSLNSTVLIRHPDTKTLLVNFDPKVKEVFREIEVMVKMGLDVPLQARPFIGKRPEMHKKFELMDVSEIMCC
jgi:dynein heavy chain